MSGHSQHAILVIDLGFGDAGKGGIVDFLTRTYAAHGVVRFNGGAQAAHNVVTPDGRQHTFSQFGSGTFVPGVQTVLSRFMLIEPYAMFNEEEHLRALGVQDAFERTLLDRRALVITPFHIAANRLRELARGVHRHGSCGMGIGETMADSLYHPDDVITAGELPDQARVVTKLRRLRDRKWSEIELLLPALLDLDEARDYLDMFSAPDIITIAAENYQHLANLVQLADDAALQAVFDAPGVIIFEGAQGVLLDEDYGFAPYTTWSKTTFANALDLLEAHAYTGQVTKLGVLRTYFTRHGAGVFVSEDAALAALPEHHNSDSPWQQAFRVGHFDQLAARYALEVCESADGLALTHVDYLARMPEVKVCTAYHIDNSRTTQASSLQYLPCGDAQRRVRTHVDDDLDRFFERDRDSITGIKVHRPADWTHQERLTQHLFHCTPYYQLVETQQAVPLEDTYLALLENALGVPIALTSHGQTARDKHLRRG